MADVTPRIAAGAPVIQSYSAEGFVIGGRGYKGAVLIVGGVVRELQLEALSVLTESQLRLEGISYLIIGGGEKAQLAPKLVVEALKKRGIVSEPMSTPAACRTHNVLLAEERQFATLLLPV
ncbi:MAG: Mth938-like domain-containing protein [Alphaproteobacteria bacterium]